MEPFLGQIIMFGGNFAPRGWAFCSGQLLAISGNSALFSILGTIYGGDGQTTFALPDLRGRAPMHPGSGSGLTPRVLGEKGGAESATLSTTQMPSHNHPIQVVVSTANGEEATPAGNVIASHTDAFNTTATSGQNLGGVSSSLQGGTQAHNNMQPYQTVNFIIALQGTYPSRN